MLHGSPSGAILAPWEAEPYRLWSLLEIMERTHPELVVHLAPYITVLANPGVAWVSDPGRIAHVRTVLGLLKEECRPIGLIDSVTLIESIERALSSGSELTVNHAPILLGGLPGRLRDEMKNVVFLALSAEEAKRYETPRERWETTIDKFPSIVRDVEEASKCLALGRNTACVFHGMRIMEVGLRALGKTLNDPNLDPKRNPSWDAILKKCDGELTKPVKERGEEWRTDNTFYSTATANIRAVKDAWRNPTMHVELHYDGEEADSIYSVVRAFMRHLATRLSE